MTNLEILQNSVPFFNQHKEFKHPFRKLTFLDSPLLNGAHNLGGGIGKENNF